MQPLIVAAPAPCRKPGNPGSRCAFVTHSQWLCKGGCYDMGLGIIAILMGLGAAGAGAYLGFGTNGLQLALPAGLPAVAPETVAILMFLSGAITMLLGAISIYRADEYS